MVSEKPSVYAIEHIPTGRKYVGSAANTSKRWSRHRAELAEGKHRNKHLQATWNRDGAAAFRWYVVAYVEASERIALEQRVIDLYGVTDPDRGFNKAAVAGVSYGGGNGGRPRSAEWLDNMAVGISKAADSRRLKIGDKCPQGHTIDGTYVRKRKGRTGRIHLGIRCQDCERTAAFQRARKRAGIPDEWPEHKHFNRRPVGG